MAEPDHSDCPFCSDAVQSKAFQSLGTVLAIEDLTPVAPGHLLVIPRRHTPDFFTMTEEEKRDASELLTILRDRAVDADPTITGFNVGINCGVSAGQQIPHAHIHFIPRRDTDPNHPTGVKGVIRNKMTY